MGIPRPEGSFCGRYIAIVVALCAALIPGVSAASAPPAAPSLGAPQLPQAATSTPSHLHNRPPSPDFFDVCATKGYNNAGCIREVLAAIDHARSHEHMKKTRVVLPRNYTKLTVAEQTFVITNLERVDRGLRPFRGLSAALDHVAKLAAGLRLDATLVATLLRTLHIASYGSNWASDYGPLSADYNWMYNDGYSAKHGINLACLGPGDAGCWGHRHNILWHYSQSLLIAGAGTAKPAGSSIAAIYSGASGAAPRFDYTWKQALHHGADHGHANKSTGTG
jgi:hypothetical protein